MAMVTGKIGSSNPPIFFLHIRILNSGNHLKNLKNLSALALNVHVLHAKATGRFTHCKKEGSRSSYNFRVGQIVVNLQVFL